jgi:hypothetical protein
MCCLSLGSQGTASNNRAYICFRLPRTKTKPKGDNVTLTDSQCSCSATVALGHHLSTNSAIPASAPLFAFETTDGSWALMRWSWFMECCNTVWEQHGHRSLLGRGFRMGGTTLLLLLGIDPWVVMVQGRWSSQAFLAYWWKCEEILPLFIGFSFESRSTILSAMSTFRDRIMMNC